MKEILISGEIVIVDDEDYEWIKDMRWIISKGYAIQDFNINKVRNRKRMHRLIIKAPRGIGVDHKNGNPLDNRKDNLRLCDYSQNAANCSVHRDNLTGFKGIFKSNQRERWYARICFRGKTLSLGGYSSPIEAHLAYCEKAKELFGEFARFK